MLMNRYFSKKKSKIDWKSKKCCVSITFDCDLEKDIKSLPILVELLDSYKIKSSFACIGKFIENYPKIHDNLLENGHEIINHTYTHPNNEIWNPNRYFNRLTRKEQKEEIKKCEEICLKLLNYKPKGFRTPHFGNLHGCFVYEILEELGYLYSSSVTVINTKSYGLPYYPCKKNCKMPCDEKFDVLELPVMNCPEHYFATFDSVHCLREPFPAHSKKGEFLNLFKKALNYGYKYNIYLNFYFDPQDVIGCKDFEEILELLDKDKNKIWIAKCIDVAEWYRRCL